MKQRHQRGMSLSGWFLVVVLILSVASVGLSTVPAYLQHRTLDGLVQSLLERPDLGELSNAGLLDRLERSMKMNNIRDMEIEDMIELERGSGTLQIHLVYEVREHLFSNVDVVMSFEEHYEKIIRP
mgnify:CR=1 FL=1